MFGRKKLTKTIGLMTTAQLGVYPRSTRLSDPRALDEVFGELDRRARGREWAEAELALGDWFKDLGSRDDAVLCFEAALDEYYGVHEDWLGVGRANLALQGAHQRCSDPDYETAAEYNRAAYEAFIKTGDRLESAWCEKERADLLWQRAIDKNEQVGADEGTSLLYQAVQICQEIISVFRAAHDESRLADCLMTRSYALLELGSKAEAKDGFSEAKAIYLRQGDTMSAMLCDPFINNC